jgi:hypothetical protein
MNYFFINYAIVRVLFLLIYCNYVICFIKQEMAHFLLKLRCVYPHPWITGERKNNNRQKGGAMRRENCSGMLAGYGRSEARSVIKMVWLTGLSDCAGKTIQSTGQGGNVERLPEKE